MYRVVITGAESTGKTTLAEQLADHFKAPLSPEFVRDFVESINRPIHVKDLEIIMKGQMDYESEACKNSPQIVFHDTNLLSNSIYAEYYFKKQPKALDSVLSLSKYDLYLFCQNEIPWQPDGKQRDSLEARDEIHQAFEKKLADCPVPVIQIKGNPENRFHQAISAIRECIS